MGQKVHPTGLRLGYNKPWRSRWFAAADYAKLLHEDLKLKKDLKARFQHAGVAKIEIERATNKLKVVSGRLNGAEIARSEWYLHGQLPLHTIRADIDYGFSEAKTTYGRIGVKCWIYNGESEPVSARSRNLAQAGSTLGAGV